MRRWLLALVARSSAPEYGVEFGGERLPVVDMHLHPGGYLASVVHELPDRFFGLASLQIDDWNTREPEELQRLRDGLHYPT